MPDPEDDDLPIETYAAAQRGDLRAQEDVVRRHQMPIRAWCMAHSPPGIDADDIAQRTFVAALGRIDEFELGTNFRAWLHTIARYQLMTERTRRRRIADYHSRFIPELVDRELERRAGTAPDEWALVRLVHLRVCLGSLADGLSDFVQWRYRDEISIAEMSERSGRTVAAIKKQLWVARRHLQTCIEGRLSAAARQTPER